MNIKVNGDNNRVAGRDYIETPIKACPCCENSVIDREKAKCNRCIKAEKESQAQGALLIIGVCFLFVLSYVSEWRADHGYPTGIPGYGANVGISMVITALGLGAIWLLFTLGLPIAAQWIRDRIQ
ncbi:hypothetical protein [Phytopseudomonas daroniae]|uniref:hypothetical protein n=1 Tax=Phytopseudomonas daroniae TaxID=2487519 RepID=UPI0010384578|nr:hypothetical protein [Pseudomonas daroniae]TBU75217.1 hypothetical protein DNK10_11215 [Pseudomonas daroniae]